MDPPESPWAPLGLIQITPEFGKQKKCNWNGNTIFNYSESYQSSFAIYFGTTYSIEETLKVFKHNLV